MLKILGLIFELCRKFWVYHAYYTILFIIILKFTLPKHISPSGHKFGLDKGAFERERKREGKRKKKEKKKEEIDMELGN